jgi:hypothetical protein
VSLREAYALLTRHGTCTVGRRHRHGGGERGNDGSDLLAPLSVTGSAVAAARGGTHIAAWVLWRGGSAGGSPDTPALRGYRSLGLRDQPAQLAAVHQRLVALLDKCFNLTRLRHGRDLMHLAGVTYRQVDYWLGKTILHPTYPNQGSGCHRSFASSEVEGAATMAAYVAAGIAQQQRTTKPHNGGD